MTHIMDFIAILATLASIGIAFAMVMLGYPVMAVVMAGGVALLPLIIMTQQGGR